MKVLDTPMDLAQKYVKDNYASSIDKSFPVNRNTFAKLRTDPSRLKNSKYEIVEALANAQKEQYFKEYGLNYFKEYVLKDYKNELKKCKTKENSKLLSMLDDLLNDDSVLLYLATKNNKAAKKDEN